MFKELFLQILPKLFVLHSKTINITIHKNVAYSYVYYIYLQR